MEDTTLYATIAQVLPLFVLALALERRTFGAHERSTDPTWDAGLGIALITMAAIGEFACFAALADHPTHSTRTAAEISLGFTGVFLFADLIWGQVTAHSGHETGVWQRRLVRAFAAVVVGSAIVFLGLFSLAAYLG